MLVNEETPGAIGKMKQFASWFTHGVQHGTELRRSIQGAQNPSEVIARVDDFFATKASQRLEGSAAWSSGIRSVLDDTP
jgi:tRNA-dihydrouridine synthase B